MKQILSALKGYVKTKKCRCLPHNYEHVPDKNREETTEKSANRGCCKPL
jgi:hypothetical protein